MAGWRETARRLAELGQLETHVGWFDSAKYPDGTPVALVATTQEFGSTKKRIPPRSFMRPAINEGRTEWSAAAASGFKAVAAGRYTAANVLDLIGSSAAGAVRQKISELNSPPLDPVTIAARKRKGIHGTKPLVATTLMLTTLTHKVERK